MSFEIFAYLAHCTEPFSVDIPEAAMEVWSKILKKESDAWGKGGGDKFSESGEENAYIRKRWEVARAIQNALKEYRRNPF